MDHTRPHPAHDTSPRRPSRRTIAAGAAWSVPAILVGAAAPAAAASEGSVCPEGLRVSGLCDPTFNVTIPSDPQQGVFTVSATFLAVGQVVNISLSGRVASTTVSGNITGSGTTLQLVGTGGPASGTIRVRGVRLTGNDVNPVFLTFPDCPGAPSGFVRFTRSGNVLLCAYSP